MEDIGRYHDATGIGRRMDLSHTKRSCLGDRYSGQGYGMGCWHIICTERIKTLPFMRILLEITGQG